MPPVTHELGHTVQCLGDYPQSYSSNNPAILARIRPAYAPSQSSAYWALCPSGSQYQAQINIEIGTNDFSYDLFANANITISDVATAINLLATNYEAVATAAFSSKRGWQLETGEDPYYKHIHHFDDGVSSTNWSSIQMCIEVTSVMTYNRSIESFTNIHFNNDRETNYPAYLMEIGSMNVKSNYSKFNYP